MDCTQSKLGFQLHTDIGIQTAAIIINNSQWKYDQEKARLVRVS